MEEEKKKKERKERKRLFIYMMLDHMLIILLYYLHQFDGLHLQYSPHLLLKLLVKPYTLLLLFVGQEKTR